MYAPVLVYPCVLARTPMCVCMSILSHMFKHLYLHVYPLVLYMFVCCGEVLIHCLCVYLRTCLRVHHMKPISTPHVTSPATGKQCTAGVSHATGMMLDERWPVYDNPSVTVRFRAVQLPPWDLTVGHAPGLLH